MAENYDITAVMPTETLDQAQRLVKVIVANGITKPHGVNFTVTVTQEGGWKDALAAAADAEATELESAFDL